MAQKRRKVTQRPIILNLPEKNDTVSFFGEGCPLAGVVGVGVGEELQLQKRNLYRHT
ncbi:hypothetical protein CHS0354_010838 [Potamilus streckersoni]|uniref:Uncharacterized protein n=1 Tax=Potamilus streckersoni TaxID=2493646 RepID=A0AAE0T965_9BIVA|nr:hypothetical protein CHS0354_010838 [Potamilus streckersoni]